MAQRGWLAKKGGRKEKKKSTFASGRRAWSSRYFVQVGRNLSYYESSEDAMRGRPPKASIDLAQFDVREREATSERPHAFVLVSPERDLTLNAGSKEEKLMWIVSIGAFSASAAAAGGGGGGRGAAAAAVATVAAATATATKAQPAPAPAPASEPAPALAPAPAPASEPAPEPAPAPAPVAVTAAGAGAGDAEGVGAAAVVVTGAGVAVGSDPQRQPMDHCDACCDACCDDACCGGQPREAAVRSLKVRIVTYNVGERSPYEPGNAQPWASSTANRLPIGCTPPANLRPSASAGVSTGKERCPPIDSATP